MCMYVRMLSCTKTASTCAHIHNQTHKYNNMRTYTFTCTYIYVYIYIYILCDICDPTFGSMIHQNLHF